MNRQVIVKSANGRVKSDCQLDPAVLIATTWRSYDILHPHQTEQLACQRLHEIHNCHLF